MVRSAGTGAQLMAVEGGMAVIKLPSGEMTSSIEMLGNSWCCWKSGARNCYR